MKLDSKIKSSTKSGKKLVSSAIHPNCLCGSSCYGPCSGYCGAPCTNTCLLMDQ